MYLLTYLKAKLKYLLRSKLLSRDSVSFVVLLVHSLSFLSAVLLLLPTSVIHTYCMTTVFDTTVVLLLKAHGHGQTHSRNFCRFKLDI